MSSPYAIPVEDDSIDGEHILRGVEANGKEDARRKAEGMEYVVAGEPYPDTEAEGNEDQSTFDDHEANDGDKDVDDGGGGEPVDDEENEDESEDEFSSDEAGSGMDVDSAAESTFSSDSGSSDEDSETDDMDDVEAYLEHDPTTPRQIRDDLEPAVIEVDDSE